MNFLAKQKQTLLCVAGLLLILSSADACRKPEGSNACYFTVQPLFNWEQGKQYCESRGATLARITSQAENDVVKDLNMPIWIGAHDKNVEGQLEWVSDDTNTFEDTGYTNWAPGEPNNWNNQDCVTMWREDGKWGDAPCDNRRAIVCEFRIQDTESPLMQYLLSTLDDLQDTVAGADDAVQVWSQAAAQCEANRAQIRNSCAACGNTGHDCIENRYNFGGRIDRDLAIDCAEDFQHCANSV